MDTALIKKLLEAAKGLPVPFYFAILFFILLGLFGNDIPERYTALVYLVFIGALGAGTWWEIQRRRGDPRRGEVEPREKPVPALPPTRPGHSDPRAAYLAELPREWNRLRLLGLDRKAAEPGSETVQLDQVYTVLNTKTPRPEKLKKEDDRHTSEDPLSALEAFWHAGQHRVVLLGRPGSGKSTFVRHLCAELAAACRNPSAYPWKKRVPGWSGRQALLPVFVSLGRFAREVTGVAKPGVGSIERFICDALDRRDDLRGFGKNLLAEIGQHGGLVCFDGLDEVPSRLRTVVRDAVLAFADEYKQCHIVITSRTHTYKAKDDWQLAQWSTHELADFAPEQIQGFIKAWYTALAVVDTARGSAFYAKKAETLQQAVVPGAPRRLNDLAGNPLLLTIMTRVHTDQELPDSRVDVFDACVDTLLVHWSAVRSEGERSILDKLSELNIQHLELYAGLRRLAFEAIGVEADADDEGRALVTEGQIRAALHPRLKDEGVKAFLEYCRDANGLLLYEGEMRRPNAAPGEPLESYYTFPHSYFQEYLAARHLAEIRNGEEEAARLAGRPAWREVVLFLAEYHGFSAKNANTYRVKGLVEALVPVNGNEDEEAMRRVELAGDLVTSLQKTIEFDPAWIQRLRERLKGLLASETLLMGDGPIRAGAGRALACLGDDRPGVGCNPNTGLPQMAWVAVLGVDALKLGEGLRSAPDPEYAEENEKWAGKETLTIEPFLLAAYPVTVAQYRVFIEQKGYETPEWWSNTGWEQIGKRDKSSEPALWDKAELILENNPVVGVSWNEAVAFCRWLSATLAKNGELSPGQVIRLPTEAEWEWAARGRDGRRWPWGDQWRPCNSEEARVGQPSAVGAFPTSSRRWEQGEKMQSPGPVADRLFDQAGNVWEWCSTRWQDSYPLPQRDEWSPDYLEGDDLRVLRGGAYWNDRSWCRGACRGRFLPWDWLDYGGFRCCVATSSSDS